MEKQPEISIVMPVFNREKYIKIAVESILNQTFTDFEFVIINDGSTDNTLSILQSFDDKRIKIFTNEQNSGIVFSRNRGLKEAQGKFIGMFDSDDVALPEKFKIQYKFLVENPEFAMVGSWVRWIDENGKILRKKWKLNKPSSHIPAIMLFRNYFVQSTILIRREAIPQGGYSSGFDIVEDSKMWFDVARKYKVANIQKYLVLYRVHSENISDLGEKHLENSKKLFKYILNFINITPTDEELNLHYLIKNDEPITSLRQLKLIEIWLLKIIKHNLEISVYDKKILHKVILNRWIKVYLKSKKLGLKAFLKFISSPLFRYLH